MWFGLGTRIGATSVLCWYQHALLNVTMANCCFQTLVHLGIEANNSLLPSGCVPVRCVDIGGTKRAVRSTWHFHQSSTRVATYDGAVSLQRYAVLSSKFSRDANDQRQGFCLLGMHQEASSIPSPYRGLRVARSETSRLHTCGTYQPRSRIDPLVRKEQDR